MSDFYTHVYSNRRGIHYRGYSNGQRVHELVTNYRPSLFVPEQIGSDSKYRTVLNQPLKRIQFDSIDEAQSFRRANEDMGQDYVFGNSRYHFAFISDTFEDGIVSDINLIRRGTIDIETDSSKGFPSAQNPKTAILTITLAYRGNYYVWGMKEYKSPSLNIKYKQFPDEKTMLKHFLKVWRTLDLDIVYGWNTDQYDIPYIVNRLKILFGEQGAKNLSPWGYIRDVKVNFRGTQIPTYEMVGITSLDYIDLYRRYMPKGESDSLKWVAQEYLGETKKEYDGTLAEFYEKDFQGFIDYNIQDVILVEKLDKKFQLADMIVETAFDSRCNFSDVNQQVRMWDAISFNKLKDQNIVVPEIKETIKDEQFAGAYVLPAQVGKQKWVISFDFESLYPSLVIDHHISPETIVGDLTKFIPGPINYTEEEFLKSDTDLSFLPSENYAASSAGFIFDKKKQGFLPEILTTMFQDRLKFKNLKNEFAKKAEVEKDPQKKAEFLALSHQYDIKQKAKKTQLVAAYGALGSKYFRFYDLRLATSVTLSGRDVLLRVKNYLTIKLQEEYKFIYDPIIYGDTDSLYISAKAFVETLDSNLPPSEIAEQIDKVYCPKINEYINEAIELHRKQYNTFSHQINMVRDVIAEDTIFVSKKRYLMELWDKEGTRYSKPLRKAVGLEMIKSTTAKFCKEWLHECVDCILKKDPEDLQILVDKNRELFDTLPLELISFPQNVNLIEEYTTSLKALPTITFDDTFEDDSDGLRKGAPIAVAAAFTYNKLLQDMGLDQKYEPIKSGVRMRFWYLKKHNPFKSHVIGMLDRLPKELDLAKWIDYDAQFDKVFQKPLNILLRAVQWHEVGGPPSVMSIFDR